MQDDKLDIVAEFHLSQNAKHLMLTSHIAATDKIFKTDIIFYKTLNVFDHSSGPLRVVNGPTSSGPNPKINLKHKSCPKKSER